MAYELMAIIVGVALGIVAAVPTSVLVILLQARLAQQARRPTPPAQIGEFHYLPEEKADRLLPWD